MERLWSGCADAVYSLEPRERQLGLGEEVLSCGIVMDQRERERELSIELIKLSMLRVSPLTSLKIAQKMMPNSFKVSCKRRYVCLLRLEILCL